MANFSKRSGFDEPPPAEVENMKLMTLIRAEDGAAEAWMAAAAKRLSAGLPGARRILLNRVRPVEVRAGSGAEGVWEAIVEGWFDDRSAAEAARSPFSQGASQSTHLLVDEILIHDSGIRPLPSKVIVAFRGLPHLTRGAIQAHWRGRHVEVGLVEHHATDFLRLYFQNHVLADNSAERPEHDYDGLPEYWLDENALSNVAADSPVMKAIAEDEKNFLDITSLTTMLVDEFPVFERALHHSGS